MEITVGMKGEATSCVEREDTVKEVGSGSLLVYATPCMVALMEGAACEAIAEAVPEEKTTVDLMFRPDRVYRDHYLTVYADGKAISSVKKMILTPGEMVVQPLNEKLLTACENAKEISVSITAEKAQI